MGLPAKLKNFNCFSNGASWIGLIPEVELPKLAIKTEEYRAGGMLAPVDVDMGLEKITMGIKAGGLVVGLMRQFGAIGIDRQMLRFNGAYQEDAAGGVKPAELIVLGKHTEFDPGNAKVGDNTEWAVKSTLSYLKWTVSGRAEIEIDVLNCIFVTDGIDRYAEIRAAMGL